MRVLLALSSVLLGVSWANSFLNQLIPDVDFDHEDCKGDACFPLNQLLHLDRQKSGKLTYNERSVAYASTENILAACLPGVAKEVMAESFLSCREKKMEDICTFAKRGWLVKDTNEESVPNLDFLKASFNGLLGGAEAVKKCMKVKEEAEAEDDYWDYYDYYDEYDEYDYLEEGESIAIRSKRDAGKKRYRKAERKRRRNKKKDTRKSKGRKNGKKNNKNPGKKNDNGDDKKTNKKNQNGKRNGKKNSGTNAKKRQGKKNGDRKYVNKPDKKPSKENEEKISKRLAKLGFTKLPAKSTLDGLECLWSELETLVAGCAESLASNSP